MIDFLRSFGFAFAGLSQALQSERNFRLLWLFALAISLVNLIHDLSFIKQALLLLIITWLLALELINSSIESACNILDYENNLFVKRAKDFAAAAVLVTAISAILIIFNLYKDSWLFISIKLWCWIILIIILNTILCLTKKLRALYLVFAALALFGHLLIIFKYSESFLFLVLSVVLHLSLLWSYIKRLKYA